MSRFLLKNSILMMSVISFGLWANAATVTKMQIISAAQTVKINTCSGAVSVQARDSNNLAAAVPVNTEIFFTGSASSLSFYSDSACSARVSSLFMDAGSSAKSFYFKSSETGNKKIIVATYNYIDAKQIQIISASGTPAPSAPVISSFSASPASIAAGQSSTLSFSASGAASLVLNPGAINVSSVTSYVVTPSATTSYTLTATNNVGSVSKSVSVTVSAVVTPPSTHIGRPINGPIYGVTVDDIANVSGIIASLKQIVYFPTTRIVFDGVNSASYYKSAIQQMNSSTYIMGELLDSTDMSNTSVAAYTTRTQNYINTLGSLVDVWEIGNEINGGWLGSDTKLTGDKVRAAYDVVHAANGATALTFFWEGNPTDSNNCIDGPGFDMFGWISNFLANPENDRVRLGLDYALISWYPQQCGNIKPDWVTIFKKLSVIFPNAKVGFGEIGTADPQYGSTYEVNLINEFYPMGNNTAMPSTFIGGYFWWYFYQEMIPSTKTILMDVLNNAILAGPKPSPLL